MAFLRSEFGGLKSGQRSLLPSAPHLLVLVAFLTESYPVPKVSTSLVISSTIADQHALAKNHHKNPRAKVLYEARSPVINHVNKFEKHRNQGKHICTSVERTSVRLPRDRHREHLPTRAFRGGNWHLPAKDMTIQHLFHTAGEM